MLIVAAEVAASGDRAALYGAVALVLTSFIGGGFAYLTSREKGKEPPTVRYVDPPTSHALPQALSELYEDALERAVLAESQAATWKARAVAHGWTEDA